ncbi:MAG: chitobiase/beta-hexosaminidase C-terminal domain-containing protein [Bacteroidales bacterium]|nr:chitobiase/beta-hexosaminidase C-terminal domain-containing protein [Bacteroidales bacterium]
MKKTLLFTVSALLLCGSLQARQWDFTGWSSETVNNLIADEKWTSDEKGNGTLFEGCYWYKPTGIEDGCDADGYLMANGVTIAETKGLKITALASGGVAIATDYQVTKDANKWSYNGPQYLWFAGTLNLTVPSVAPGTKVRAGVESHKNGDKRGIDMYIGDEKIAWTSPEGTAYPDTYTEYEWVVPETYEDKVDITFKPSKGCHVYFINVEEGDDVPVVYNVAYIYDGSYNLENGYGANGGLDNDPIYTTLLDNFTMTAIDVNSDDIKALTAAQFNDSIINFDAVVLSEAVSSGNTYAKGMVDVINKVPMVNFKSFMYKNKVWSVGAGVNPNPKTGTIQIHEDYLDSPLFEELDIDEDGNVILFENTEVTFGNLVQAYTANAGGLFADDEVLATVVNGEGTANAIHVHSKRNQYILLPLSSDNLCIGENWNVTDNATKLAVNAVKMVAATKAKVLPASKPFFTQENKDGVTTVTITCSTSGSKIYYTLDDTDPTEASPVYSAAFDVTVDGTVVKAFATAQGYEPSEIAVDTIKVMSQTAAPQIAVNGNVVTITGEGALYYNYNGIDVPARSAAVEGDIVVPENTKIYAFAVASGKLQSELVSARVYVSPTQQDTLSVFDPNETDWFKNVVLLDYKKDTLDLPTSNWSNSAAYYFGKSTWKYYSDEVDHTEVVYEADGVTPVKSLVDPAADSLKTIYKVNPESVKYAHSTTAPAWYLFSQGQPFTGETNLTPENGVGNGAASRYAEKAEDLIGAPTKGALTFGGKADGDPYTASVVTSQKYVGPFDIVTYIGNGNGSGMPILVAEVSADGENWTRLDTIPLASTQRYFKKNRISYTENAEVYVRIANIGGASKAQIYNIYLLSGNMEVNPEAGIEDIAVEVVKSDAVFDLQGRQVAKMVPGQLYIQNNKKVIVR